MCEGVFRGPEGRWYLDHDCNGTTDQTVLLGTNNDLPVVGDWTGDGVTDLGVYRPSIGRIYLDNGDKVWQGCAPGPEICFNYGLQNDKPVAGDWNGNGIQTTGLWRPSNGIWYLEMENNGWGGCGTPEWCPGPFGMSDDKPFAGNWTGAAFLASRVRITSSSITAADSSTTTSASSVTAPMAPPGISLSSGAEQNENQIKRKE
jgi:hypothetical protein